MGVGRDLVAEWSDEAFVQNLTDWIDSVIDGPSGPLETVKVRQWAGVWQVPIRGVRHYVKVGNPGQAFEGALLAALGSLAPAAVITPVAVNQERGWWLMPDGGPTVRQAVAVPDWSGLLRQTAALQCQVGGHRSALSMVPAVPLATMTEYIGVLIDELTSLPSSDPQFVAAHEAAAYARGLDRLRQACELLASTGIAETLQPNDVHINNACAPHDATRTMRLFDLGDAVWSHPFGVLHMPLRMASSSPYTGPLPVGPVVDALADAYLDSWRDEIAGYDRNHLLAAADRIGCVHRIASWQRLLAHVDPATFDGGPPRLADWLTGACR